MCRATIASDPAPVLSIIQRYLRRSLDLTEGRRGLVLVNGVIAGLNTSGLVDYLLGLRRSGCINPYVSIAWDNEPSIESDVKIMTDGGRLVSPLLIVKDGALLTMPEGVRKPSWEFLLSNGYVEYVDKAEEEWLVVADFPHQISPPSAFSSSSSSKTRTVKYTHCEIHPAFMFGVGATIIPFATHNQSPRITYQSAMGNQGVGFPFREYRSINAGTFQVLQHAQKPICQSMAAKYIGYDALPTGQNAMVEITARPFNEEDSIEINQSSIDRGFMVSYKYISHFMEIRPGERLGRGKPDPSRKDNFARLGEDGVVPKGETVFRGDALACKMLPDGSVYTTNYDGVWPGVVDKVDRGRSGDGFACIRILVIQRREPVVGDKFSSRISQKGVVGIKVRQEDMPFDMHGVSPDIILSSLAFPSRMTIGMLIEMWTGKIVTSPILSVPIEKFLSSSFGRAFVKPDGLVDATPFGNYDIQDVREEAAKMGITLGDEQMRDGITGELRSSLVLTGPCFYQRLKHQVIDKVHARAKGSRTAICRQPSEGRSAGGGLKIGYMERDCMFAQGAARLVKDRLLEQSDKFMVMTCAKCGLFAYQDAEGRTDCKACEGHDLSTIAIPFGTKLTMQALMGMNIVPRIYTR